MIDKETLGRMAKLNNLKPWQQEKHYLQALILTILSEQQALVFKGGTYLWFFHGLPRFSEDLDFTAIEPVQKELSEEVSKSLELFGIENKIKIFSNHEKTFSFRISAKGPLHTKPIDECRVYVEISKRETIAKKMLQLKLDFPAYQLPIKHCQGMNLEEVGAEKIRAILTRDKARDLYDLYYLIKKKHIPFNLKLTNQKLGYYNKKFEKKEFEKAMAKKQAEFKKELQNMTFEELPSFQECKKNMTKWIKK